MVSLVDDGCLKVTVEDLRDPARPRWRFTFRHAPICRNILEEYRLETWELVHQGGERKGWTVIVPSPALASATQGEGAPHRGAPLEPSPLPDRNGGRRDRYPVA